MSLTLSVNITEFNLKITDIVWLNNNGTTVSHTSEIYTITNSSLDAPVGTTMLFVETVTSPVVYGGIYQVIVINPAGSDTSTFNVSIKSEKNSKFLVMNVSAYMHAGVIMNGTYNQYMEVYYIYIMDCSKMKFNLCWYLIGLLHLIL